MVVGFTYKQILVQYIHFFRTFKLSITNLIIQVVVFTSRLTFKLRWITWRFRVIRVGTKVAGFMLAFPSFRCQTVSYRTMLLIPGQGSIFRVLLLLSLTFLLLKILQLTMVEDYWDSVQTVLSTQFSQTLRSPIIRQDLPGVVFISRIMCMPPWTTSSSLETVAEIREEDFILHIPIPHCLTVLYRGIHQTPVPGSIFRVLLLLSLTFLLLKILQLTMAVVSWDMGQTAESHLPLQT